MTWSAPAVTRNSWTMASTTDSGETDRDSPCRIRVKLASRFMRRLGHIDGDPVVRDQGEGERDGDGGLEGIDRDDRERAAVPRSR